MNPVTVTSRLLLGCGRGGVRRHDSARFSLIASSPSLKIHSGAGTVFFDFDAASSLVSALSHDHPA